MNPSNPVDKFSVVSKSKILKLPLYRGNLVLDQGNDMNISIYLVDSVIPGVLQDPFFPDYHICGAELLLGSGSGGQSWTDLSMEVQNDRYLFSHATPQYSYVFRTLLSENPLMVAIYVRIILKQTGS